MMMVASMVLVAVALYVMSCLDASAPRQMQAVRAVA